MRSLTVALALGLGAFASVLPAQDPPQKLPPRATIDTVNAVTVQNNRKVPVTVYLEQGRFDFRLGIVSPMGTETLRLPAAALKGLASVRLSVHPQGEAGDLMSQHFTLPRAARITLLVPSIGDMGDLTPADTMTEVIPPEDLAEATLTVDNPRDEAVTVFARRGPFDTRIGRVPARGRATLRFPKAVVGVGETVTLFVQPDGGRDLASETIKITRGQHVGLRVPVR